MAPLSNGDGLVTRRELELNLRPMKDDIHEIRSDVSEIRTALGAGPRWLGARANAVVDKLLPTAIAICAVRVMRGRIGS